MLYLHQLHGFFKGMAFPVLTTGLINAIVFGSYSNALDYLTQSQHSKGKPASAAQVYTAGSFSGLVQVSSPMFSGWFNLKVPHRAADVTHLETVCHANADSVRTIILSASYEREWLVLCCPCKSVHVSSYKNVLGKPAVSELPKQGAILCQVLLCLPDCLHCI